VRDVDAQTLERLKARALMHRRSLQAEVKAILEAEAALGDRSAWTAWVEEFRAKAGAGAGPDSADLLREARDERQAFGAPAATRLTGMAVMRSSSGNSCSPGWTTQS
jgi:plasmid stability protein